MQLRAIPLSEAEAIALAKGHKTQFRRKVHRQPQYGSDYTTDEALGLTCPYGAPDDKLWVQEPFAAGWINEDKSVNHAEFVPIDTIPKFDKKEVDIWYKAKEPAQSHDFFTWRSGTQLPQWASRFMLIITDVSLQRLHDISDNDAIKEGVMTVNHTWVNPEHPLENIGYKHKESSSNIYSSPVDAFKERWSEKLPWNDNPYVWVVSFKVKTANTQT